jgi:hypothetical protein
MGCADPYSERDSLKYREYYHPLDDYSGDDYEAAEK